MRKSIGLALVALLILSSCSKVPITGRRQLNLLPSSQMQEMSMTSYNEFLSTNQVVADSDSRTKMIKRVGEKIAAATEKYLSEHGHKHLVDNFDWQFNLVEDPTLNAWCMPGGRVVFYTGILPVCKDENGIAVVMGHEVAHAVAKHGNERMSQQIAIQGAGMTLGALLEEKPALTQDLALQAFGVGSQLGSLAYSREHESEADKMGLIFMAIAGYNPREAPELWKRMSEQGGAQPPEFLSTHPNHETRISDLEAFMPEALKFYDPQ